MNIKIIKNEVIRKKYSYGFRRDKKDVTEIVLHATAGGGTIKWMEDGGKMPNGETREADYKQGIALVHYHISRIGEITEIIDPLNYVYHSSSREHDQHTICIEIGKLKSDNSDLPTNEQYNSLLLLIEYLKYNFKNINKITTHDYCARVYSGLKPKPCPGILDWSILEKTNLNIFKS